MGILRHWGTCALTGGFFLLKTGLEVGIHILPKPHFPQRNSFWMVAQLIAHSKQIRLALFTGREGDCSL